MIKYTLDIAQFWHYTMSKFSAKIDLITKLCAEYEQRSLYQHLKELGIPNNLTDEQIRRKLRQMAGLYHPDRSNGDTKMFQKIMDAYKALEKFRESNKGIADLPVVKQTPKIDKKIPVDTSKINELIDKYSLPPDSTERTQEQIGGPLKDPIPHALNSPWGSWYNEYKKDRPIT
jgi:hypothetical protein